MPVEMKYISRRNELIKPMTKQFFPYGINSDKMAVIPNGIAAPPGKYVYIGQEASEIAAPPIKETIPGVWIITFIRVDTFTHYTLKPAPIV